MTGRKNNDEQPAADNKTESAAKQRIHQPLLPSAAKREQPGFLRAADDNDTISLNRRNGDTERRSKLAASG